MPSKNEGSCLQVIAVYSGAQCILHMLVDAHGAQQDPGAFF